MKYKIVDILFRVFVLLTLPVAMVWATVCGLLSGVGWTWKRIYTKIRLESKSVWKCLKWGLEADKKQREKMLEGLLRNTQSEGKMIKDGQNHLYQDTSAQK